MYIYLIVNRVTGKYYVGQHKGNNLKKYLQDKFSQARYELKRGRSGSSHLFNSMRKHPDHSVWSIHALLSDIQTRAELDQHERDFIALLKSQDPEYGYNICRGGEGFSGPHSAATRQIISQAAQLMWKRPEIKENFSTKMGGRAPCPEALAKSRQVRTAPDYVTPAETIQRLRDSHTGLNRSEESKKKQAQSVTGNKNHFYSKKHSEETRTKMREAQKRLSETDPTYRERVNKARKTAWTPERRAAQSARIAAYHQAKRAQTS